MHECVPDTRESWLRLPVSGLVSSYTAGPGIAIEKHFFWDDF